MAQRADREIVLSLPRPLAAGETAFIAVEVGPISRGREITIATAAGRALGTVSPFGARAGQDAGTFTVPVPAAALENSRLALRLTISRLDGSKHAPTADEVRSVKLSINPK